MIDVTGSTADRAAMKKVQRLQAFIERERGNVGEHILHGVVLAPLVTGDSSKEGDVQLVQGRDAQHLLGGLSQVLRWFECDE